MTDPTDLPAFVAGLPKAELHVHHIGSAAPHTVAALAERYAGSTDVPADPEQLATYFTFTDFAHFVTTYLSVVDLIRDPQDIWTLTRDIGVDLAAQNVRYVELTLTPYSSVTRGIPAEAFCEAVEDARRRVEADHDITMRWCFDIPGESGIPAGDLTLDIALGQRPDGLVSFGLGGPEIGVPRSWFESHFAQARAAGLHSVPHAGESTGPETVWDAIRFLGAERIGHGINAIHDPALLAYLADRTDPAGDLPDVQRLHSLGLVAGRAPAAGPCRGRRAGVDRLRRPADVRDRPWAASTSWPLSLLGLDRAGVAELARASVRQSFADDATQARHPDRDRRLHRPTPG